MNRKEFIKDCGYACAGMMLVSLGISSCAPAKYVQVENKNNILTVLKSEFVEGTNTRKYIIVKTPNLDYPVIVYRFSDTSYQALLLKCTHQGSELNVNGDMLTCPAHGSEFGTKGEVLAGPADQPLTSFRVTLTDTTIQIHLV
jgi:Rieske Fe-S protein